jgi:CRISPR-associated exonuclease Cas4
MFSEDDLLPISALQHLAFCERQWALIHLEGIWADNRLTVEGSILHERTDEPDLEVRGNTRIARALSMKSLYYGISGKADVVEFHRFEECDYSEISNDSTGYAITLEGVPGLWLPVPVEYKRGKPKPDRCDEVQLCAQAFCLEEMLECTIPEGFLYYGLPRKRFEVRLDEKLRQETIILIGHLHELNALRVTPPAAYEKKCNNCSLKDFCLPRVLSAKKSTQKYLASVFHDALSER